ncbi:exosortase A [Aromatoleum petrolei]|uniref:Exosortase A n=1 Tax=Aromatoleum petrolei TaxID=76116 RepID=A0ABX1MHG1_9RHOO|nr:exosortase A [Aromatoleum petrolei]NMF87383.1 exosortase A [Aromatoleum petrolei]QTQ35750.1 Exosortase 1 [Aromatoleum petrolei]
MSAPEDEVRRQADGVAAALPTAGVPRATMIRLAVLAVGLVALVVTYRGTVGAMVEIWGRSDTFAHGYLVAPITCWLIWRERARLRELQMAPSLVGMAAAAVAGFAWLLGELASVASVSQFAFVGMVVALVWAVMGTRVARALAFPLGFLFFLVPFGEFLFPAMMDRTTDFIIWGLRGSGVPVYAEGRSLVIPSGHWEVVEGCSGVRYLIASVVVGSLYAYLTYRSPLRRTVFVAFSVVLPVFANWLRAYGIVFLAHVSDNKIAAGVDHLIYGWVFFGLVMMALFWVGARWREDELPGAPAGDAAVSRVPTHPGTPGAFAAAGVAAILIVLMWQPVLAGLDAQGRRGSVTLAGLNAGGGWERVADTRLPDWKPHFFGMNRELREVWSNGGPPVGLYLAYYRGQGPGQELVNSENRVLKHKDRQWTMTAEGAHSTKIGAEAASVLSTEIADAASGRLLVWHWYWIDGRWTASDYVAKVYQTLAQLRGRGDDSVAVMVYTPVREGARGAAEAVLADFLRVRGGELSAALARARER